MRGEQTASNREPQSGATLLPRDAVVDLLKIFKNTVVVRCRNARTCIPHRDGKMVAYCAGMHFHRAGVSELDGVADDIQQHLGQTPLISITDRKIRRDDSFEFNAFGLSQDAGRGNDRFHKPLQRVLIEGQAELAGFDLGDIEHIVDQTKQMFSVLLHPSHDLQRLVRQSAVQPI
jgi:hypothetical protein